MSTPDEILSFWLEEPAQDADALKQQMRRWYMGGAELDAEIDRRFGADVREAVAGGKTEWEAAIRDRLALVILLDQFTRSVFRDKPEMYGGDARAQELALDAFDRGLDRPLAHVERMFLMMPLLHAEDLAMQERSVELMAKNVADSPEALRPIFGMGIEQSKKYRDIIGRFGRFPHRNAILGRESTEAELELLRDWKDRAPPSGMKTSS
jgi:uncharacterized protein (DUF924 family)